MNWHHELRATPPRRFTRQRPVFSLSPVMDHYRRRERWRRVRDAAAILVIAIVTLALVVAAVWVVLLLTTPGGS